MAEKTNKKDNAPTIESKMKEIDEILTLLENEDTGLEASFELYKKGMEKINECNNLVDRVEKELVRLEEGSENEN